jgi:hypothetical protein
MTHKEAKEILIRYKNWSEGNYAAIFKINELNEALDVAIQCLEDSIEGFQLMEGVKEANEKLEDLPREYKDVLCSCDNPNAFKEMDERKPRCSKCNKFY